MKKTIKADDLNMVAKCLGNINLLRKYAQKQSYDDVKKAYENLGIVLLECEELFEQQKKEEQEKESKRLATLQYLKEQGLSLKDLIEVSKKAKKKTQFADKYVFTNQKGEQQYWSGMGRMPKDLQSLIESGRNLEEFLIEK